jgi:lycopene cyclase domain-containing protein
MKEYTTEVVVVLLLLVLLDAAVGTWLFRRWRFWAVVVAICAGTLLFDGYLNARPVLAYGWRHLSGIQLWVVPIEDFGYGIALAAVAIITWELAEALERAGKRSR